MAGNGGGIEHENHVPPQQPFSLEPTPFEYNKEKTSSMPPDGVLPDPTPRKSDNPPSALRENLFMVFITLTQLVQMIPLGAGINSSIGIGEALGSSRLESTWIVASYPLTQGAFVLIGKLLSPSD